MEDINEKFLERIKEETNSLFEERTKGLVSEESFSNSINEINEKLNAINSLTEKSDTLKKGIEAVSKELEALKETRAGHFDPVQDKAEFIKAVSEAAKKLKAQGGGNAIVEKTLADMTIAGSVTGQVPQAAREPGITNLVRQMFNIRNASNVSGIASTKAEWVEQTQVDGSAGMTAEGTAKSQVSWEYQVNDASVRKITDYVKVTTEMLSDVPGMMSEIDGNLLYQLDLKEESQLLLGDGTGQNLQGIDYYNKTLSLAALANSITNPNYFDVLASARTQIRVNGKGELIANRIFLNPVDLFLMIQATKDTTDNYIQLVPTVTGSGLGQLYVYGIPVIESDSIPQGYYMIGDMTKFNIRDYERTQIMLGYENDDFTKNFVTIRGERRLVSYIKSNHTEGFIYDTFAAGLTFLEAAS